MTENLVQEITEEDTQKDKFLTFSLGNEFYGIDIKYVIEIIGIQLITEVPQLPEYIKGIINLRGKIIPVIDVRLRFKKSFREYNDRTCIIVIEIKDISVGMIVDAVSEVLSIPEEDILQPPELNGESNKYIKAIGKINSEIKLILDCDKLLSNEETENLINIQ
ncbi:chemotaxis protein CheW [Clostridium aceticum]|nr:chemotaxis protein CheW [Clostridium aceticum]KJF27635.1 chemotaxis protein CheW [Clostridium aceticum]